ncbi:hypothetical protein OUZ56_009968 [Daphnia magna]|uniref:Uncharacterized protein n=1 Tax=Daphnia magna TaxID=35525 RepID=A0ABR0AHF0_9CRUS|nr:hypothetical protein OUZ56_009968 [Daphnia magna]
MSINQSSTSMTAAIFYAVFKKPKASNSLQPTATEWRWDLGEILCRGSTYRRGGCPVRQRYVLPRRVETKLDCDSVPVIRTQSQELGRDLQSSLYEENQLQIKLQMEVDSKDSEIEQLSQKLASASADTVSNISSGAENESEEGVQDSWLEGWLFIPSKQNIRRHDLNKVFHVRSVTQGDVIRADAKEIPRILQILYAGEGESRKPDESTPPPDLVGREEKPGTVNHKGHELVAISFTCQPLVKCAQNLCGICSDPHLPLSAAVHKEHLDKREEIIAPCKFHYDPNTAKEMLLLAGTLEEQQQWISRLSKKIQKFNT